MANSKNKKKSQATAKAESTADSKAAAKKAIKKDNAKSVSKKDAKAASKSKKGEKPGLIARAKKYLSSVRSEMRRVTWPSKKELRNYSIAVCISLVVVGVVIHRCVHLAGGGWRCYRSARPPYWRGPGALRRFEVIACPSVGMWFTPILVTRRA